MFEEVGKRIREAREKQGMTMKQVADKIGVTEATFSRYESGHIEKVPLNRIEDIADVLHVDPAYLLGWKRKVSLLDEPGIVLAAHRENGYDDPLPPEAMAELESILGYLKEKYRKK